MATFNLRVADEALKYFQGPLGEGKQVAVEKEAPSNLKPTDPDIVRVARNINKDSHSLQNIQAGRGHTNGETE